MNRLRLEIPRLTVNPLQTPDLNKSVPMYSALSVEIGRKKSWPTVKSPKSTDNSHFLQLFLHFEVRSEEKVKYHT